MYVFDATPLIYLAKAECLALLDDLPRACVVPEPVHEEVVTRGIEEGHADARRIERTVEGGVVDGVGVEDSATLERLERNRNLSRADAAVLAIADERDATAVVDEQYGRDVAAVEAIETRGTAYLVVSLSNDDAISADRARETIDAMMDAGWYCAPDLYAKIRRKIDELA